MPAQQLKKYQDLKCSKASYSCHILASVDISLVMAGKGQPQSQALFWRYPGITSVTEQVESCWLCSPLGKHACRACGKSLQKYQHGHSRACLAGAPTNICPQQTHCFVTAQGYSDQNSHIPVCITITGCTHISKHINCCQEKDERHNRREWRRREKEKADDPHILSRQNVLWITIFI